MIVFSKVWKLALCLFPMFGMAQQTNFFVGATAGHVAFGTDNRPEVLPAAAMNGLALWATFSRNESSAIPATVTSCIGPNFTVTNATRMPVFSSNMGGSYLFDGSNDGLEYRAPDFMFTATQYTFWVVANFSSTLQELVSTGNPTSANDFVWQIVGSQLRIAENSNGTSYYTLINGGLSLTNFVAVSIGGSSNMAWVNGASVAISNRVGFGNVGPLNQIAGRTNITVGYVGANPPAYYTDQIGEIGFSSNLWSTAIATQVFNAIRGRLGR